jgi:hypothetical protein
MNWQALSPEFGPLSWLAGTTITRVGPLTEVAGFST